MLITSIKLLYKFEIFLEMCAQLQIQLKKYLSYHFLFLKRIVLILLIKACLYLSMVLVMHDNYSTIIIRMIGIYLSE
jgi:hypothetical protein